LTELNHPDHLIITYPDLGHEFFSSSQWTTGIGLVQQQLAAHSGLSHSYAIYYYYYCLHYTSKYKFIEYKCDFFKFF
ncbi:MAG: hypothetical protein M3Y53_09015, partial [Thermoproteota archaeon]|nr:hypothetical protein [Thermoproteota archaeon]